MEDHDATLTGVFADYLARPWANCTSAVGGAKDLHKIIAKGCPLVSKVATDSEATRAIIQRLLCQKMRSTRVKTKRLQMHYFYTWQTFKLLVTCTDSVHVEEYLHAIENADKRVSAVLEALRKRQGR